jgi:23S rRNA pseudouridine955/2504/2580 synthase
LTGRKHQLRVLLAHVGNPIVGDTKYGKRVANKGGMFLFSQRLVLEGLGIDFSLEVPGAFYRELDGDE